MWFAAACSGAACSGASCGLAGGGRPGETDAAPTWRALPRDRQSRPGTHDVVRPGDAVPLRARTVHDAAEVPPAAARMSRDECYTKGPFAEVLISMLARIGRSGRQPRLRLRLRVASETGAPQNCRITALERIPRHLQGVGSDRARPADRSPPAGRRAYPTRRRAAAPPPPRASR
jgi:hypothetical protein